MFTVRAHCSQAYSSCKIGNAISRIWLWPNLFSTSRHAHIFSRDINGIVSSSYTARVQLLEQYSKEDWGQCSMIAQQQTNVPQIGCTLLPQIHSASCAGTHHYYSMLCIMPVLAKSFSQSPPRLQALCTHHQHLTTSTASHHGLI